ncbi:EAL domain-containing protein [Roseobacter sp.]|uniref:putative bifunctional diguanylate cyclase/phosphodiesterase n=1 Tax=Roseobacter sp. TaxID=1907202 RepID=UPI003299F071
MRNEKITDGAAVPTPLQGTHVADLRPNISLPIDRMQTPLWIYDVDNARIVFANAPACVLWQADNEADLQSRDMATNMSPAVATRLKQYQRDFIENDATFTEMWTLYPNGKPTSVMVVYCGYRMPDGRMAMQCEAVGDTENQPENLRSAEALLHTDVMIALHDDSGQPLYMNPAARDVATHATQTVREKFIDPSDYDRLAAQIQLCGEHRLVSKVNTSGGPRWHDLTIKKCVDAVTGDPATLLTAIDVSELKIARDKARYLADRDQLTGCYNRSYLQHYMSSLAVSQSGPCALLCFDIDRFKQINDRLGHEMGDVVLKEVASRVAMSIRATDTLIRLGGDEFVVLFENITSAADLAAHLEDLLSQVSAPISHDATRVNATISIGVTLFTPQTAEFTAILREADIALYAAKQAGRDRLTFFTSEMGDQANARDLVEIELKRAIEQREFILHYQPRVSLQTGSVVSVEALVRWQHPDRGLVMPAEFISICEETGMIEELGQLVLEMACTKAVSLHQAGRDIQVSVNISPRQFEDKRLLGALECFAQHPDFPSGKIELEITENVLIGDHDAIAQKLETIANMGYQIAIDDFGTGYSNLAYILRFPLNCLKIDQSFVSQLPKSGPIVALILTLGEQIGATVVAEGVETPEQLAWLKGQNCTQVQGYYLSPPVAPNRLRDVIHTLETSAASAVEQD